MLSSSCINANSKDHESNNGEHLDTGKVELNFSVKADGKKVYSGYDSPEATNEDTDVEVCAPVLDNETTSSQLQSICDGP